MTAMLTMADDPGSAARPHLLSGSGHADVILLGTLLALCSSGSFYVVPDFLAAVHNAFGLSLAQLGWVAGAESLAIALACTLTGIAIRRTGQRAMLAAAAMCVLGNLASIFATDFPLMITLRTLTGLLGEGPLYAMGYAMLASARSPDRAFGIAIGCVAGSAALIIGFGPRLDELFGPAAVLVPYAGCAAALILFVSLRPPPPRAAIPTGVAGGSDGATRRGGAILVSLLLWSAAAAAFFAFTTSAAEPLGVPASTISRALSIGLTAGLAGVIVPVLISDRFGRATPLAIVTGGLVLSCWLFFDGGGAGLLIVAIVVQQFSWNVASAYQLAGLAALDASGRFGALGAVAQVAGMALGPAVSGTLLGRFGYGVLPILVTIVALAALGGFFLAPRK